MGREWVYNLSGGGANSNNSSSRKKSTKRSSSSSSSSSGGSRNSSTSTTTPSGCMNAVFQLFDINHYFNFPLNSPSASNITTHPRPLQGVVAPRNSLEIQDTAEILALRSATVTNQQSLQLPVSGIQIKTRVSTDQDVSSSSESAYMSGSPGTKTPTLVARLMGLDLLPETSSPRPSSSSSSNLSTSKSHLQHLLQKRQANNRRSVPRSTNHDGLTGTCSLPETPRTSSSSARRSDVDQRFSLQINKENSQLQSGQEFEFSKFLTAKIAAATAGRQREENMSPGQYAKQIVKQFKESVSRRVGRDITNTVEDRSEQRRDQHVVLLKSKKPSPPHKHNKTDQENSCSPKLRISEIKSKSTCSAHSPKLSTSVDNDSKSVPTSKVQTVSVEKKIQKNSEKKIQKTSVSNKISNDHKYGSRICTSPHNSDLIRTKQEESFVKSSLTSCKEKSRHVNIPDKKCKKSTPLSNVPTVLAVKKNPSPPATRLPHQEEGQSQHQSSQSQVKSSGRDGPPSCLSQIMYQQKTMHNAVPHPVSTRSHCNVSNVSTTTGGELYDASTTTGGELYDYISRILKHTGVDEHTAVSSSISNWYSPSHPLDPAIFHHLKVEYSSTSIGQSRLVFDVVDELLAGILKPYLNLNLRRNKKLWGGELINTLCVKIRSFPLADCRDLEDIDRLIDTDLGGSSSWEILYTFEEEFGDVIVSEVEGDILDRLMHETLLDAVFTSVR